MEQRNIPGTLAHQYEVEVHLVQALDDLLWEGYRDCTLVELAQAFARCAGALLGGILCQLDEAEEGPVDVQALLDDLRSQLREAREVGVADWTGEGR